MARTSPGRLRNRQRQADLRQRYGLLLVCLVVLFLVSGIVPGGDWQEVLLVALCALALVLALRAGEVSSRIAHAAATLGCTLVVVVAVLAVAGVSDVTATRIAAFLLLAVAPPAVVVGVIRGMRAQGSATVQAVFGVLCVYLLIGMMAAFLYGTIDRAGGHPFFASGAAATTSRCLYFSFTTLTTVGYGDLTARTNLGHTLSVSEALVGQIYLVTVVALLVADLGRRTGPGRE